MPGSLSFTVGDTWVASLGQANSTAAVSIAIICKPTLPAANMEFFGAVNAQGTLYNRNASGDALSYYEGSENYAATPIVVTNVWQGLGITRPAGSGQVARLHSYRFDTGALVQVAETSTTSGDVTPDAWRIGYAGAGFGGKAAAAAVSKSNLSDATMATALRTWQGLAAAFPPGSAEAYDLGKVAPFNGTGTSTQTTLTGTTHSTDEPPGFWPVRPKPRLPLAPMRATTR